MQKEMKRKKVSFFKTMPDVWSYLKPYKVKFSTVVILRTISQIAWLYPAFASAKIIDFFIHYKQGDSLTPVFTILITFASLVFIATMTRAVASYWGFSIGSKINFDAEQKVLQHLTSLDMSWHEHEYAGSKLKRITRGSYGLERLVKVFITDFIEISVGLMGVLIIIGSLDLKTNILLFIFIMTYGVISLLLQNKGVRQQKLVAVADEKRGGIIFELINNIRTVKVLNVISIIFNRLALETEDTFQKTRRKIFIFEVGGQCASLYANLFFIGCILFISIRIGNGTLTLGFLVLFFNYFDTIWGSVYRLAKVSEEFATNKSDFERMQSLLERKPSIDIEEGKTSFPKNWSLIQLKNLSFKYGENQVLNSINLDIKRGQKIGIVGLSGAGKSTLFKLLSKENESYEGEIDVDGVALKTISKSDYLNNTTVVLQETELFNNSLAFNITFGTNPDKELLEKAITTSHVREFVAKLKDGLDTVVGEKGVKLSGGEKQRVGIARAVYKNPQILLMDEATSHLDIESEKKIQDSLHEFFKSVTAIVIAHRLTTIKEMDTIVLIEDGKISEQGSFDELYAKQGRFFELWSKQKL